MTDCTVPLLVPSGISCDSGDRNPLHSSPRGWGQILTPSWNFCIRLATNCVKLLFQNIGKQKRMSCWTNVWSCIFIHTGAYSITSIEKSKTCVLTFHRCICSNIPLVSFTLMKKFNFRQFSNFSSHIGHLLWRSVTMGNNCFQTFTYDLNSPISFLIWDICFI